MRGGANVMYIYDGQVLEPNIKVNYCYLSCISTYNILRYQFNQSLTNGDCELN